MSRLFYMMKYILLRILLLIEYLLYYTYTYYTTYYTTHTLITLYTYTLIILYTSIALQCKLVVIFVSRFSEEQDQWRRVRRFSRSTNVFTRLTIVSRGVERGRRGGAAASGNFVRSSVLGNIAEGTSVRSFLCLPEDPPARRRAINHKSVTARRKLLESLFPAFSLFGREASSPVRDVPFFPLLLPVLLFRHLRESIVCPHPRF